jgi:hypothetical protein
MDNVQKNNICMYMLVCRHQNAGQNHDMKMVNRSFENTLQLTTLTNQNLNQEEIKRRLNLANAGCRSVQNLLSSRLLSKLKTKLRDSFDVTI